MRRYEAVTAELIRDLKKSFFILIFGLPLEYHMETNQSSIQTRIENEKQFRWFHHRRFKIICICFTGLIIFAIVLGLLLRFVILTPKDLRNITTTTTILTTITATTMTTTDQKSGKSESHTS